MLICNDCGKRFEDETVSIRYEDRGEWFGFPSEEKVYCCPFCGSDNIEEAEDAVD